MDDLKVMEWRDLLTKNGGAITPEQFFENAKRKSSAFHDDFEWDPKKALADYYLRRASNLIVYYSSRIPNVEGAMQRLYPVRQPEPDRKKPRKVFMTAERVMQSTVTREQVVEDIWNRWRTMVALSRDYIEFSAVISAVEHLIPEKKAADQAQALRETA